MFFKKAVFYTGVLLLFACVQTVAAGECTNNNWQPTFVRNDKALHSYYVTANGTFIPMQSPQHAQATCKKNGVRRTIGGKNCQRRNWGDFSCGCNIYPAKNSTCRRFQQFLRTQGFKIP